MRERYPKLEFDKLRIYFGEPYDIPCPYGSLSLTSFTIGDLIELGEARFRPTLNIIVSNTTMYRSFLWDLGIDWNEASDFELFCIIYRNMDPEATRMLLGGIDLLSFKPSFFNSEDGGKRLMLVSEELNMGLDEGAYQQIHQYYQEMFSIHPEDELTDDARLKKWWVDKDKRAQARRQKKSDDEGSSMQPLVSALVNHPGFKYKLRELKEVGVAEFYDSVRRLQIYEQSTALLKGLYSGMVSSKDVDPKSYDWMKQC